MRRWGAAIAAFISALLLLSSHISAVDTHKNSDGSTQAMSNATSDVNDSFSELRKFIPEDVLSELPEGIFDGEDTSSSLPEKIGVKYIFGKLWSFIKRSLLPAAGNLASLLGMTALAASFGLLADGLSCAAIGRMFTLCATLAVACHVINTQVGIINGAALVIGSMTVFSNAIIPILTALLISSGNTLTASVTGAGLLEFTTILANFTEYCFLPLCRACFGLAIIAAISENGHTDGICGIVKKTFTVTAGFAAALFTAVMTYQTTLTAAADGVAARSIKYAIGSSIPVVGGALGDAIKGTAAGLSLIKSSVGAVGIVVIILIVSPVLINLFLNGAILGICSAAAKILGCDRIATLMAELKNVSGFILAVVALSTTIFIIGLSVFLKINPALSV
jgi:stage III sporulation protein AE